MKKLVIVAIVFLLSTQLFAAGTVATTPAIVSGLPAFATYTMVWTSTAGGAVSGNAFTVRPGHIMQLEFIPAAGGSQPSDLYDVTLVDTRGVDYLGGSGANLSNATSTVVTKDPGFLTGGISLDLVVANAGATKSGTVVIWVGP